MVMSSALSGLNLSAFADLYTAIGDIGASVAPASRCLGMLPPR